MFMWSKVIYQSQRSFEAENVKMVSFEKLKYDLNQTWFIAKILEPSYVNTVRGHKSRSKVI